MTGVSVFVSLPDRSCQLAWDSPIGTIRTFIVQSLHGASLSGFCTKAIDLMTADY